MNRGTLVAPSGFLWFCDCQNAYWTTMEPCAACGCVAPARDNPTDQERLIRATERIANSLETIAKRAGSLEERAAIVAHLQTWRIPDEHLTAALASVERGEHLKGGG